MDPDDCLLFGLSQPSELDGIQLTTQPFVISVTKWRVGCICIGGKCGYTSCCLCKPQRLYFLILFLSPCFFCVEHIWLTPDWWGQAKMMIMFVSLFGYLLRKSYDLNIFISSLSMDVHVVLQLMPSVSLKLLFSYFNYWFHDLVGRGQALEIENCLIFFHQVKILSKIGKVGLTFMPVHFFLKNQAYYFSIMSASFFLFFFFYSESVSFYFYIYAKTIIFFFRNWSHAHQLQWYGCGIWYVMKFVACGLWTWCYTW